MLKVDIGAKQRIFLVLKGHADLSRESVRMQPDAHFAGGLAYTAGLHAVIVRQVHRLVGA